MKIQDNSNNKSFQGMLTVSTIKNGRTTVDLIPTPGFSDEFIKAEINALIPEGSLSDSPPIEAVRQFLSWARGKTKQELVLIDQGPIYMSNNPDSIILTDRFSNTEGQGLMLKLDLKG